jgi:16S rRNA (adenine1518-N6/adenine1519-N6)-dimethyltransferase
MGKTKLGQHFLIDDAIIQKELSIAQLTSDDVVLEIGPGKGVLTSSLAKQVKQVIAVELDSVLYRYLETILPDNVLLIHNDIMKVDWDEIPSFTKVVANLPYQISSPFTFKLFETQFEKAVLIYQKEFAMRMIAPVGSKEYSRLTVGIAYKASCSIHATIPPKSFSPPPEVNSSLVEIVPYEKPPFTVVDEPFFYELTNLLFSHRRKQIKTILKKNFSKKIPESISFGSSRVETLSPEEIASLSNQLYSNLKE